MKKNQEYLSTNDTVDKGLYRKLFEIQIELEKFAEDRHSLRQEVENVILAIDQLFQNSVERREYEH